MHVASHQLQRFHAVRHCALQYVSSSHAPALQISNTAKLKKMSKKQLRSIKKADTSGVKPKVYEKSK